MKALLMFVLISYISFAQDLDKKVIKEVLDLQKIENSEAVSEVLYQKYISETSYNISDVALGTLYSGISGASQGLHESYTFGYTHTEWMPKFMQQWYSWHVNTDAVYGKVFTWHKVFREVDYSADRAAYYKWKRFFAGKWYLALPIHWTIKSTCATIIRAKMKKDNWFYDFNPDLIFTLPELPIF